MAGQQPIRPHSDNTHGWFHRLWQMIKPRTQIEPAERPSSILDALNDDCLRYIIELGALEIDDYVSIAGTCDRLNRLAKEAFAYKRSNTEYTINRCRKDPLEYHTRVLRIFGQQIKSIRLHFSDHALFTDKILELVALHCPNIKHLSTSRMDAMASAIARYDRLSPDRRRRMSAPFGQLHTLEFKVPSVHYVQNVGVLPAIELPSLRRFSVERLLFESSPAAFREFFVLNRGVTVLCLSRTNLLDYVANVVELLPNLAVLDLMGGEKDARETCGSKEPADCEALDAAALPGRPLQKLTTLKIHSVNRCDYFGPLLAALREANAPIEHLHLSVPGDGCFFEQLKDFKHIKTIKISVLNIAALDKMIRFLHNKEKLERISIDSDNMTAERIHEILQCTNASLGTAVFNNRCNADRFRGKEQMLNSIERTRRARDIDLTVNLFMFAVVFGTNGVSAIDGYDWLNSIPLKSCPVNNNYWL